ncbi:MAG: DUF4468 domain-containing protein [Bacteroidaceae bacterium]|nr:DUF4468 domain-containing protein [Bacteroidaceae bacterium]
MKKAIISFCIAAIAMAIPQQLLAQKNENANHEDSYYLKGAVPEVNGKVVFSKEYSIEGMSKNEVFDKVQTWMKAHMQQNDNNSRVAYTNEEKGQLAATGEEYIIFSNSILALDRTKVLYQMIANCDNGKCVLQIRNIRYDYPNEKELFLAEDWIADKVALTKDQSRLVRGNAKWRRKTVDWVDDINESLQKALSGFAIAQNDGKPEETRKADAVTVVSNQVSKTETAPAKPVAKAAAPAINPTIPVAVVEKTTASEIVKTAEVVKPIEAAKVEEATNSAAAEQQIDTAKPVEAKQPVELFPELTADKIQASNGKMVIIIGEDEFNRTTMTANAGGYLSVRNGKKFINTMLTAEQPYQSLQQAKEYMVAFYPNGAKQPSVVMKCTNVTTEKPVQGRENIFTGEIKSVEIR